MEISCPQCGATIPVQTETRFHRCPYCASAFTARTGGGILHYFLAHRRDDRLAWSILKQGLHRWRMNDPVGERKCEPLIFPFWLFQLDGKGTRLVPAAPPPLPEMVRVTLPGGDLQFVRDQEGLIPPAIPFDSALERVANESAVKTGSLVYVPLYILEYEAHGIIYRAVVSPLDRKIYADERPEGAVDDGVRLQDLLLVLGFTAVLVIEAIAIKFLFWRAATFAGTLAAFYLFYNQVLRREV